MSLNSTCCKIVIVFLLLLSLSYALPVSQSISPRTSPMTKTELWDSLNNGRSTISTSIDLLRDETPIIQLTNPDTSGSPGGAIVINISASLSGIYTVSDATSGLTPIKYWTYSGYPYIIFDTSLTKQEVLTSAGIGDSYINHVAIWKNVTRGGVTILNTYYAGDDFFYDNTPDGADSCQFDTASDDSTRLSKNLYGGASVWPLHGDSLVPFSYWTDGTYTDVIREWGKQGETFWMDNMNGAGGATNLSAAINVRNHNHLNMPGIVINEPDAATGWDNGRFTGWTGLKITTSRTAPVGPLTYNLPGDPPWYAIHATGAECQFGDGVYDTVRVGGPMDIDMDVVIDSTAAFVMPYGAVWPTSPVKGETFFKTIPSADTLGIYNGTAWKKFVPDA